MAAGESAPARLNSSIAHALASAIVCMDLVPIKNIYTGITH